MRQTLSLYFSHSFRYIITRIQGAQLWIIKRNMNGLQWWSHERRLWASCMITTIRRIVKMLQLILSKFPAALKLEFWCQILEPRMWYRKTCHKTLGHTVYVCTVQMTLDDTCQQLLPTLTQHWVVVTYSYLSPCAERWIPRLDVARDEVVVGRSPEAECWGTTRKSGARVRMFPWQQLSWIQLLAILKLPIKEALWNLTCQVDAKMQQVRTYNVFDRCPN